MTNRSGGLRRVGVLGGTFDPIHIGHLIIAEEARYHLSLDQVLFVPARVSPLKQEEGTRFDNEARYEMVRRAVENNAAFEVSRVDLDREPPSYTVDTLHILQDDYGPHTQMYFIMGMDSLVHLHQWYQPEEIIRLADLIVLSRPGYDMRLVELNRRVPGLGQATHIIQDLEIGISSTEIRRRLDIGLPIRYQVPEPVAKWIDAHRRRITPHLCQSSKQALQ